MHQHRVPFSKRSSSTSRIALGARKGDRLIPSRPKPPSPTTLVFDRCGPLLPRTPSPPLPQAADELPLPGDPPLRHLPLVRRAAREFYLPVATYEPLPRDGSGAEAHRETSSAASPPRPRRGSPLVVDRTAATSSCGHPLPAVQLTRLHDPVWNAPLVRIGRVLGLRKPFSGGYEEHEGMDTHANGQTRDDYSPTLSSCSHLGTCRWHTAAGRIRTHGAWKTFTSVIGAYHLTPGTIRPPASPTPASLTASPRGRPPRCDLRSRSGRRPRRFSCHGGTPRGTRRTR